MTDSSWLVLGSYAMIFLLGLALGAALMLRPLGRADAEIVKLRGQLDRVLRG